MTPANTFNWDAAEFFERLTTGNKLAKENEFQFLRVSSLEGFHDALTDHYGGSAFVAVSDVSTGFVSLVGAPRTRRIKTVFLAMRHAIGNDEAREECFAIMREIFRQFMSALIIEGGKVEEHNATIDTNVTFNEIDKYFYTDAACAYFQLSVDSYTDLQYNLDEWL